MTIDTFAQNMLKELAEGKEINWDYMPNMVSDGKVRREDATSSLRNCLGIVIPEYERIAKTGDAYYWGQRLAEAKTTLKAIDKGQEVKYRGIKL